MRKVDWMASVASTRPVSAHFACDAVSSMAQVGEQSPMVYEPPAKPDSHRWSLAWGLRVFTPTLTGQIASVRHACMPSSRTRKRDSDG